MDVEAEGKLEQEPPEDTRPTVSEAMGVDHEPGGIPSSGPQSAAYIPGVASSSGGPIRMPTIPEERPENLGIPQENATRNEVESVAGMQPEAEPSIAASVRSPRSTEVMPERNVRQRTEGTEPRQTTRTTGTTGTTGTTITHLCCTRDYMNW